MAYTEITYEKTGRVAKVTLSRPRYRNPISRITIEEMDDAFADAAEDDGIGAIVLCGQGEHFSAGHDLGTPEKQADDDARPFPTGTRGVYHRSWYLYIEHGLRWRNLPKPTIGVIHGKCIWGGWMVASTMDILFAAEDARFLGSNFQYFCVPWDVGIRKAKEILFEPRFITAREAQDLGFVNRVFKDRDEAEAEAMAYAARVATNSIFNLRMTKVNINLAQDMQGFTNHIVAAHSKPAVAARRAASGSDRGSAGSRRSTRRPTTSQRPGEYPRRAAKTDRAMAIDAIRVLEVGDDPWLAYCGLQFALWGADVVVSEQHAHRLRGAAPTVEGVSLGWTYLTANKRVATGAVDATARDADVILTRALRPRNGGPGARGVGWRPPPPHRSVRPRTASPTRKTQGVGENGLVSTLAANC